MPSVIAENATEVNGRIADCFIYGAIPLGQSEWVLNQSEFLKKLRSAGAKNGEIATALKIHPSQVTRLFAEDKKPRDLTLDEAAILAEAFELEQAPRVEPLPPSMLRLVVRYVALALGAPQERTQARLEELTEALRAFSEFVSDPKVRRSTDMAEGFFQAMLLRRPEAVSEARQGTDPEPLD